MFCYSFVESNETRLYDRILYANPCPVPALEKLVLHKKLLLTENGYQRSKRNNPQRAAKH